MENKLTDNNPQILRTGRITNVKKFSSKALIVEMLPVKLGKLILRLCEEALFTQRAAGKEDDEGRY